MSCLQIAIKEREKRLPFFNECGCWLPRHAMNHGKSLVVLLNLWWIQDSAQLKIAYHEKLQVLQPVCHKPNCRIFLSDTSEHIREKLTFCDTAKMWKSYFFNFWNLNFLRKKLTMWKCWDHQYNYFVRQKFVKYCW